MRSSLKLFLSFVCINFFSCDPKVNRLEDIPSDNNLANIVNPLMGTDSEFSLSNGNTYPAIALPWGMNFWTPMTGKMGDGWMYKYDDHFIYGFKQTHQPSPWINDYAAFSLMAVTGKLKFKEDERRSWFSHKAEKAHPHYYKTYLADYDITVEISPTERAAQFRFTFPENDSSFIILDAFDMGSTIKTDPSARTITGYCRNNHGGVPENFRNYFIARFDKDFEIMNTWGDGWKLTKNSTAREGNHVGAIIGFRTKRGEQVHVEVASSFISPEQAQQNLDNEIGNQTFEETKINAFNAWNKELNRIRIIDDNPVHIRTFYSCLYRLLLFPRKFYEINQAGEAVHFSPYNGQVLPGYMFTDNGFWDTFRAVFPFFNLMYPSLNNLIMKGLENTYRESGWLPEWASPGHRDCMIGSNSASIIADAYVKGQRDFDAELLLEAMLKNADNEKGRPVRSVGREGLEYYNMLGYVPYDVKINENAARTLEYAYADFAIARMASLMGKEEVAEIFYNRAFNYKNLFDPSTGWMRGKNVSGSFQAPFNPLKWGDAFTEGNSLHYTWSVFQDVQGLIELMGGDSAFAEKLNSVFTMSPEFDDSYYGFTIHEIREMQIVNMGNYAHGNQPVQHMIYLYNYAHQPWKTQEKVREVMEKLYAPEPDGYCGDEDNGQTSAWYIFTSMGFYPVTPATTQYVIGSPLFDRMILYLENGKRFVIEAEGNTDENIYIKSAGLNGKSHNKTWIDHSDILNGGTLKFMMDKLPDKSWGVDEGSEPFSLSTAIPAQESE